MHVLLIDDEIKIRKYVRNTIFPLVENISSFSMVESVEEALKEQITPELILLDHRLGYKVYGTSFIGTLRERFPDALIVGFSMNAENRSAFLAAGADGFVHKAMVNTIVAREVEEFLNSREN
jgi:DNA-binding NarL/FixJ family response regulator